MRQLVWMCSIPANQPRHHQIPPHAEDTHSPFQKGSLHMVPTLLPCMMLVFFCGNWSSPLIEDRPVASKTGRSERKCASKKQVLNGCLCGIIADSASDGVLKCKQAGCETQWVFMYFIGVMGQFYSH